MGIKDFFIRNNKEQAEHVARKQSERDERDRQQRIKSKIAYDEQQAVHRGRVKYLERNAAKTGGGGCCFVLVFLFITSLD